MTEPNFKSGTVWTGDNLLVMRGMNSECVDLIYADPPFNSNRNYEAPIGSEAAGAAFKDAWTLDDINVHEHGELADRHPGAYAVIDAAKHTDGKSMMAYLIFMAVRLIEMHRILKSTGSIYLHCDDTANSYLRLLMDAIFGKNQYQNQITWKRTAAHNDGSSFGRVSDTILFYGGSINRDDVREPLSKSYVANSYNKKDWRGSYQADQLTGPKTSSGESGSTWQGWNPTDRGRCWSVPKKGDYAVWIDKNIIPGYCQKKGVLARLDMLHEAGMIEFSSKGTPRLKRYLHANPGQLPNDIWTDIPPVSSRSKEAKKYPTQKPLKLLERIIKASSNEGDIILDPFCGCATALVIAYRLERKWAGIDLSPLAVKLVNDRIIDARGPLFGGAIALDEPPKRTDLGDIPNYRTHRHRLYGEQEGVCVGCDTHFPFRVMEVDHKLPQSKGGTHHEDNLQLLCSHCNRSKGNKTMAEWRASQV